MFVRASGNGSGGKHVECSWHLLAEADDGPFIPSMAAEGIIRKLVAGDRPRSGARPATSALELADYKRLFEGRSIFTGFRGSAASGGVYQQILASAFDALPDQVRALHSTKADRTWTERAEVRRGRGPLSRAISSLFGFPDEGVDVPVSVRFAPDSGGERWTRTFGNSVFSSHQSCGTGRDQYLLVERFGVVAVSLALVSHSQRLFLIPRRLTVLGMPMPRFLLPKGASLEFEQAGRFHFDVVIMLPVVGLLTAYRGYLQPD